MRWRLVVRPKRTPSEVWAPSRNMWQPDDQAPTTGFLSCDVTKTPPEGSFHGSWCGSDFTFQPNPPFTTFLFLQRGRGLQKGGVSEDGAGRSTKQASTPSRRSPHRSSLFLSVPPRFPSRTDNSPLRKRGSTSRGAVQAPLPGPSAAPLPFSQLFFLSRSSNGRCCTWGSISPFFPLIFALDQRVR